MDTTNNKKEISSIIRNYDKAFAEPVAERNIYFDLLQKILQKGIFVFAYQGKKDIGYCALYANDSDTKNAYISLLAVCPEYQNLHIEKQILNICLEIAESYGMQTCSLEVRKNNISAIRFYQTNGFVFLSEQMDSFIMKRDLQMQKGKTNEKRRRKENALCESE